MKFKEIFVKRNRFFPVVAYTTEVVGSDKYIEIAAVEQLKFENEKAYEALAGNICGYCWKKMEDEPTAKQTHQEYANQLLVEISALKSKLKIAVEALEFYADPLCYVEDAYGNKKIDYCKKHELAEKALSEIGGEI